MQCRRGRYGPRWVGAIRKKYGVRLGSGERGLLKEYIRKQKGSSSKVRWAASVAESGCDILDRCQNSRCLRSPNENHGEHPGVLRHGRIQGDLERPGAENITLVGLIQEAGLM